MSNYPLPPTPPGPFDPGYPQSQDPSFDALAPARRAGVMLWILGGLGVLCGVCIAGSVWVVPADKIVERLQSGMTAEQRSQLRNVDVVKVVRIVATLVCAIELAISAIMLATAAFVRRGSRLATGIAMVLCVLTLLWGAGVSVFNVIAMAAGKVPATSVVDVFVWGGVALASGVTILWLIQAMSAGKRVEQQRNFQAQYWMYQQQQQQQPGGYGYGAGGMATPPVSPQGSLNLPPLPGAKLQPPPPPPPAGGTGEGSEGPSQ